MQVTIALDAMGGDHGPSVCVPAALAMLADNPDLRIILVGQEERIQPLLNGNSDRLSVVHASEVVQMDEKPADALRKKKDSSLRVAINLVKEEQYRRANGHRKVCTENAAQHRPAGHHGGVTHGERPHVHAGPWRQLELQFGTFVSVCRYGFGSCVRD